MPGKNSDIEALRTIAILTVVFAHAYAFFPMPLPKLHQVQSYFDYWGGVDLFFCVSGFIITKSLISEMAKGSHSVFSAFAVPFWIKRAFRLWPAAWFWLTFVLIASIAFNKSGEFGKPLENFVYQVWAMLHAANVYGFYCKAQAACGANQVYWSLSLEEQFYLFYPFIFFFLPRKWILASSLLLVAYLFPINRGGNIMGFFRLDPILIGVSIALWTEYRSYKSFEPTFLKNGLFSIPLTIGLVIALGVLGSAKLAIVPQAVGFIAVLSGLFVVIASYDNNYITNNALVAYLARTIGARSYSLYLTHIPAALFSKELLFRLHMDQIWQFALSGLVLTLLFTEFSYRVVETPLRNYGRSIARNRRDEILNDRTGPDIQPTILNDEKTYGRKGIIHAAE